MRHVYHFIAVPFVTLMVLFPGNGVFRGLAIAFGSAEAQLMNEEVKPRAAFNYFGPRAD